MRVLALMAAFTVVGSLIVAIGVSVYTIVDRASEKTVNAAFVMLVFGVVLVFGIVLVLLGVTAWLVLAGAARLRQAQHARPSHNIAVDRRTQNIDARRVMLVNADGEQLPLPAGARLVEVMQ